MEAPPDSLIDGESIPCVSVTETEFVARRPLIDFLASLLGWLAILIFLAGPATAAT